MLVQMTSNLTGFRDGEAWPPVGGTVELPDLEAERLVAAGLARVPGDDDAADEPTPEPEPEPEAPADEPADGELAKPRRGRATKAKTADSGEA